MNARRKVRNRRALHLTHRRGARERGRSLAPRAFLTIYYSQLLYSWTWRANSSAASSVWSAAEGREARALRLSLKAAEAIEASHQKVSRAPRCSRTRWKMRG